MTDAARLHAPATLRNRDALLAALRPLLPALLPGAGLVLEVASGTGEHAAFLAAALPDLAFQPTDIAAEHRASIDAWSDGLPNVRPALALDAAAAAWPVTRADAVLCVNMVHIAPWAATAGLVAGAARVLPPGGALALYGPFLRRGHPTAPSNAAFDAGLRTQDPAWGVRDLEAVAGLAMDAGFGPPLVTDMPANNLLVAFRHTGASGEKLAHRAGRVHSDRHDRIVSGPQRGASMADYVIPPAAQPAIPVTGGGLFPVRRVFCVGRNYAAHAREMGHDPTREAPFFFMKPADTLLTSGADMPYPSATADLHHELELVVALGAGGADVSEADAAGLVWGYAAGLDMTRRDMQAEAKKQGRPWDMGKGFDHSAPIGPLARGSTLRSSAALELRVNGAVRQRGDLSQLIWSVPEMLAFLSRLVRLASGDLIFTGTPSGVAAVVRGDVLEGTIEGVGAVRTRIA